MDLDLDDETSAFRAEVRAFLREHVPAQPLPSMDTAEGWALHQEWEAKLAAERLSVVSWPREVGGREASLIEWVIFEEEYYRAGAPQRVTQNGIFLLAPTLFEELAQITSVVAVLQDWDPARETFLRRVRALGAELRVLVVREGATTRPWRDVGPELGELSVLAPSEVERSLAAALR